MKKTVRFVCLALLFISVFCSGTYFGKAKASNALFSVLQAYSTQKPSNQIQASTLKEDALYSTVSLLIRFEKEGQSKTKHGTGIIYSLTKKDGNATILTCEHLFREEGFLLSEIQIFLYGLEFSQSAIKGEYLGGSAAFDCALVAIKNSDILRCSQTKSATFEKESAVGQSVYAAGNALGEGIGVSKGVISGFKSKEINHFSYPMLQTDAALNFGCSGGGIFSESGTLLGMICAKEASESANGIGYALPSYVLSALAKSILKDNEVRLFLPNFTCVTAPYIDKKNATAGQRLAVAESADTRIYCGDILLYGVKDGGIEVFTDTASFAKFLLACESEHVLLGFYRHGEIIEISNAVLMQTVIA